MFWRKKQQLIDTGDWEARTDRPRALIENPDPATIWAYSDILRKAGYDVAVCAGEDHDVEERCPLLVSARCPLVEGADVVVSTCSLVSSDAMLGLLARPGHPPVVFEAPAAEFERYRELAPDAKLIAMPVMRDAFLEAVERARADDHRD